MGKLGEGDPPKTPADGGRVPIRLAFGDIQGMTGKFWANKDHVVVGDGEVKKW